MKMNVFAGRTAKEILRDPISLAFGIGFPVVLLFLLTVINRNAPETVFLLERLTPGIAVFGLSFMSMFSAQLISRDRETSLLARLLTAPMSATDYILGYTIPLLPMALAQCIVCYFAAFLLGLEVTAPAMISLAMMLPVALIFIGVGLLCGSLFNEKAATVVCGALLTNLTAWLSGTWFSLDLAGGAFKAIAYGLPFVHAVDMGQAAVEGVYASMLPHAWWVVGYGGILLLAAILVFRRRMSMN